MRDCETDVFAQFWAFTTNLTNGCSLLGLARGAEPTERIHYSSSMPKPKRRRLSEAKRQEEFSHVQSKSPDVASREAPRKRPPEPTLIPR